MRASEPHRVSSQAPSTSAVGRCSSTACQRADVGPCARLRAATKVVAATVGALMSQDVGRTPRQGHCRRRHPHPSRSEEHTSELQSRQYLVCRLLLEKNKNITDVGLGRYRCHGHGDPPLRPCAPLAPLHCPRPSSSIPTAPS